MQIPIDYHSPYYVDRKAGILYCRKLRKLLTLSRKPKAMCGSLLDVCVSKDEGARGKGRLGSSDTYP